MPKIVLAEDEAQLRSLIGEILSQRGISVMEAEDGAEALNMIRDNPSVSLLLSDVKMPRMNGYELVEASLQVHPELKVLMMTAYAADHPPPALLRAREIRTLIKPFDPDRMADLVCDMLGRP